MSCRFTPIPVTLADGALRVGDRAVLSTVPAGVSAVCDPFGHGVVVRVEAEAATHHLRQELGRLAGVRRFTCCYRYDPWWVAPRCGRKGREIPVETQYLLAELPGGACVVLLPLLDGPFRCAIEGTAKDALALVADSNDPGVVTQAVNGLFVAAGDNPYELMHAAAQSLVAFMGRGRLREDKPLPDFINDFGWCTWDAFYGEVNHDKVRAGLQSFADAGVPPRMMILDDGWLSHRTAPTGENRLTAFAADPRKFPQGLAATVTMAKAEFGLRRFLVWHTLQGYWGGVDAAAFPEYTVVNNVREFSPGVVHNCAQANAAFGRGAGLVHPRDVHRFFQDFHRHLRSQGVDGVKVDNQSTLEGVARGLGGRAAVMQAYHEAVEGAAQTHFLGRLINCMSHATDVIYQTLNSTLTRSYTDFWPRDPKSHGLHQYANAQNSLWLSEFIHPDWDMFQSDHPMAPLHAAARAVSGGPVYVSDKPGVHNVELLRKLVLSDGTILRARGCGRPTRDCLFHDTTKEDVLLKVFNRNGFGGVIGVFQTQYHEAEAERKVVSGTVGPADVEGLEGEAFAVYAHNAGALAPCRRGQRLAVSLREGGFEVFTVMPVRQGFAPIGLADKFNSGAAITEWIPAEGGGWQVGLRDGGRFVAWCERAPAKVLADGRPHGFAYDAETGALSVSMDGHGPWSLVVVL